MRSLLRGALLAALVAVLLVPLASAGAQDGRQEKGKRFSVLIFSKTAAFRHTECIPQGTVAIAQLAAQTMVPDGAPDFIAQAYLAIYEPMFARVSPNSPRIPIRSKRSLAAARA